MKQYRVMIPNGEDCAGCQWRPAPPTAEELSDWREEFICDVWVEEREVTYGESRKLNL